MDPDYISNPDGPDAQAYANFHPDCAGVFVFMAATQLMVCCPECRVVSHLQPVSDQVDRYHATLSRTEVKAQKAKTVAAQASSQASL